MHKCKTEMLHLRGVCICNHSYHYTMSNTLPHKFTCKGCVFICQWVSCWFFFQVLCLQVLVCSIVSTFFYNCIIYFSIFVLMSNEILLMLGYLFYIVLLIFENLT